MVHSLQYWLSLRGYDREKGCGLVCHRSGALQTRRGSLNTLASFDEIDRRLPSPFVSRGTQSPGGGLSFPKQCPVVWHFQGIAQRLAPICSVLNKSGGLCSFRRIRHVIGTKWESNRIALRVEGGFCSSSLRYARRLLTAATTDRGCSDCTSALALPILITGDS